VTFQQGWDWLAMQLNKIAWLIGLYPIWGVVALIVFVIILRRKRGPSRSTPAARKLQLRSSRSDWH